MRTIAIAGLASLLTLSVPVADATPLVGTINNADSYSVIHDGAAPSGSGDRAFWRWFEDDQQILLDLNDGLLTLAGEQSFSLTVPAAEARATVTFLDMTLNLDGSRGFAGGSIVYRTDSIEFGVFGFDDRRYGSSPFNSSTLRDGILDVYIWGGDRRHDLGIDLAISVAVAEPHIGKLVLAGLFVLAFSHGLARRQQPLRTHI